MTHTIKNLQAAEEAAEWAITLDAGPLVRSEREALASWLRASPIHVEELLQAASILSGLETVDPKRNCSVDGLLEDIAPEIIPLTKLGSDARDTHDDEPIEPAARIMWNRYRGYFVGLAASIVLFVSAVMVWDGSRDPSTMDSGTQIVTTETGEQRSVVLADGSLVHVNTQSQIEVVMSDDERTIRLTRGEAMFEVEHDADRPFRVIAGDTIAEAIGTKFNMHWTDHGVNVVVVEGKVAVSGSAVEATDLAGEVDDRILLSAGEELEFDTTGTLRGREEVNTASIISWRQRQLTFESDSLQSIVDEFNRYNRKQMVIADSALGAIEFSGVFAADDPESLIEFLQFSEGIDIDTSDENRIVLSSKTVE